MWSKQSVKGWLEGGGGGLKDNFMSISTCKNISLIKIRVSKDILKNSLKVSDMYTLVDS